MSQTVVGDDSGFYGPLGLLVVSYLFPREPTMPQLQDPTTTDPTGPVQVTAPDGPISGGSPNSDGGGSQNPDDGSSDNKPQAK